MAENNHFDSNPPPQLPPALTRSRWWAPSILVLLVIGFYWKLVLTDQYTWLQSSDLAYQVLPWYQFEAGEWRQGRIPLWDPNHWLGQPMLGQTQPGLAYPLNWILFSLRLKDGWIRQAHLHWYFVVIHLMAALFAYALARDLKRSRRASILAGVVFALAAYVGNIDWPQMLNGAVWAPLVFLYLFRVLRGERPWTSAALGGLFLGMAWLSGHHQIPIYICLAAGGTWLYHLAGQRMDRRRLIALFLLFWLVAGMAGALQILPAYEYGKNSLRWIGLDEPVDWQTKVPYDIHKRYSLSPISLLGVVFPGMYTNADPFLGIVVVVLVVMGVWRCWAFREVRILTAIVIGAFLFATAHHNVFHGILYAVVPLVEKARSASMAVFLLGFGASILAAFGLDRVLAKDEPPLLRNAAAVCLSFGAFIWLVRLAIVMAKGHDVNFDDRPMMTMVAALLAGTVLYGWYRGAVTKSWCAALLIGLFLVEASNDNSFFQPNRYDKTRENMLAQHAEDSDIVDYLRKQPGPIRVLVNNKEIQYNFGDWHGIHTLGGYLASVTANFHKQEPFAGHIRRLLGTGFYVSKEPDAFYPEEAFTGKSGRKVWVNRDVFPRAFVVHEAAKVPHRDQIASALSNPSADLRNRVYLIGDAPSLERCGSSGEARVADYLPNRVTVRADLPCRGMVILTDTYYPGWQAIVDGKRTAIHEAYGLVRGVVVEKGTHTIEFRYRPPSVLWGGFLSAAALLLCGLVATVEGRRMRRR